MALEQLDVITKVIIANEIKNGGILVNAPRGADQLDSNYLINPYAIDGISGNLPTTGTVGDKYDVRFTGCDFCST